MVGHVFSQYIYFSLSVLSCFGVIDCSQDKYDNEQKRSTYVHAFLLDDFKKNEEMLLNIHGFFYFRDKCVVNYHMVRGNCPGKKMKKKIVLETTGDI